MTKRRIVFSVAVVLLLAGASGYFIFIHGQLVSESTYEENAESTQTFLTQDEVPSVDSIVEQSASSTYSNFSEDGSTGVITPPSVKKETHSEIDTEASHEYNVLRETNSIAFSTTDWNNYRIVSLTSDYGFTLNFPKEWVPREDGFMIDGKRIVGRPPGVVLLHENQTCLDSYQEALKTPDPDWAISAFIKQETVAHNGKNLAWVQAESYRHDGVINIYCIQEGNAAFAMTFLTNPENHATFRDVVSSVRITK